MLQTHAEQEGVLGPEDQETRVDRNQILSKGEEQLRLRQTAGRDQAGRSYIGSDGTSLRVGHT